MFKGTSKRWFIVAALMVTSSITVAQQPTTYNLQKRVNAIEYQQAGKILITADEVNYDEELGAILARGNVEIAQGERLLTADSISYNQKSDTVSASGNINGLSHQGGVRSHQRDVGCMHGHLRATGHCKTHIRSCQRRRIVDSIAHHGHHLALLAIMGHCLALVVRQLFSLHL